MQIIKHNTFTDNKYIFVILNLNLMYLIVIELDQVHKSYKLKTLLTVSAFFGYLLFCFCVILFLLMFLVKDGLSLIINRLSFSISKSFLLSHVKILKLLYDA